MGRGAPGRSPKPRQAQTRPLLLTALLGLAGCAAAPPLEPERSQSPAAATLPLGAAASGDQARSVSHQFPAVRGARLGAEVLQRFEFATPQMGMPFRIVVYAPEQATAQAAVAAAWQRIAELNALLSDYDTDSELSRLNQTAGQGRAVPVSPDLWRVLRAAQALARRTHGAFDITAGPYISHWRKARRTKQLPTPEALARAREAVGYAKLRLDPRKRTAELTAPFMRLDLGAIAKGYALDEALRVLRQRGLSRALVVGGGDMAAGDPPPNQPGWRIAVAEPNRTKAQPSRFVNLRNAGLATSGDAFQHVEIEGRRYSHIVDPRTGLGLTDHSQVTVIARDAMTADSLATAVSVLGPVAGLRLVERTRGAAAWLIRQPGSQLESYESRRWRVWQAEAGTK